MFNKRVNLVLLSESTRFGTFKRVNLVLLSESTWYFVDVRYVAVLDDSFENELTWYCQCKRQLDTVFISDSAWYFDMRYSRRQFCLSFFIHVETEEDQDTARAP